MHYSEKKTNQFANWIFKKVNSNVVFIREKLLLHLGHWCCACRFSFHLTNAWNPISLLAQSVSGILNECIPSKEPTARYQSIDRILIEFIFHSNASVCEYSTRQRQIIAGRPVNGSWRVWESTVSWTSNRT